MAFNFNPFTGTFDKLRNFAAANVQTAGTVVEANDPRVPINNLVAVVDPAVTNDNTEGYGIGSLWKNNLSGSENIFIAQSVVTGAAVWRKITTVSESGVLIIEGGISYGDATTVDIAASVDNLTPPLFDTISLLRLNITVNSNITGLIAPTPIAPSIISPTKEVYVFNTGTANGTLRSEDALSLAPNRFHLGANILLQSGEGLVLLYDNVSLRYRSAAKNI